MKAVEIIKTIMENVGVRPSVLASRLRITNAAMSARFTQKNLSIDKMNEMLRAMDYKLVAVPRETRLKEGEYEVE